MTLSKLNVAKMSLALQERFARSPGQKHITSVAGQPKKPRMSYEHQKADAHQGAAEKFLPSSGRGVFRGGVGE
jgi:hypothetical protein